MSPRILIIALLPSILLGVACAYLFGQVQRERERTRAESELRSELESRIAALDGTRNRSEQELRRLRALSTEPGRVESRVHPAMPGQAPAVAAAAGVSPASGPFPQPSAAQLEWMRSPIARDLMRSHQRDWLLRSNAELFELLDLPPEQTKALIELMVDAQSPGLEFGMPDPADPEALQRKFQEHQRKTDAALKELLGDEKYRTYQEYQGSVAERMQVAELQRLFDGTSTPLGADQSAQILAALLEQREHAPNPMPGRNVLSPDDIEKYQQWFEDQSLRVREHIAVFLTPEQLERYNSYQQMQDALRREAGQQGGMFSGMGTVAFSSSGSLSVQSSD